MKSARWVIIDVRSGWILALVRMDHMVDVILRTKEVGRMEEIESVVLLVGEERNGCAA